MQIVDQGQLREVLHRLNSIPQELQDFHQEAMQIEGIRNGIVFSVWKRKELIEDRLPILVARCFRQALLDEALHIGQGHLESIAFVKGMALIWRPKG